MTARSTPPHWWTHFFLNGATSASGASVSVPMPVPRSAACSCLDGALKPATTSMVMVARTQTIKKNTNNISPIFSHCKWKWKLITSMITLSEIISITFDRLKLKTQIVFLTCHAVKLTSTWAFINLANVIFNFSINSWIIEIALPRCCCSVWAAIMSGSGKGNSESELKQTNVWN